MTSLEPSPNHKHEKECCEKCAAWKSCPYSNDIKRRGKNLTCTCHSAPTEKESWEEEAIALLRLEYNHSDARPLIVFISKKLEEAKREPLRRLANWIDGEVGASSEALYLYMSCGQIPAPFSAPRDSSDRGRCVVLLRAMPEWIPRLGELEELEIYGHRNDVKVYPWKEQIPLIRAALTTEE